MRNDAKKNPEPVVMTRRKVLRGVGMALAALLRDFLANTLHDVLTPLTVLQGHLSTMQQQAGRGEGLESGVMTSAMGEAHYLASLVHNRRRPRGSKPGSRKFTPTMSRRSTAGR